MGVEGGGGKGDKRWGREGGGGVVVLVQDSR